MNLIFYMPEFAKLPVSVPVLLIVAVVCTAMPGQRRIGFVPVLLTMAAVTIALLANGDKLLLAAVLLLALSAALAIRNGRSGKE